MLTIYSVTRVWRVYSFMDRCFVQLFCLYCKCFGKCSDTLCSHVIWYEHVIILEQWMNEQTSERCSARNYRGANERRNKQTSRQAKEWPNGRTCELTNERTHGRTTNELTNRRNIGANTNTRERYTTQNEIVRFMFHLKQQRGQ